MRRSVRPFVSDQSFGAIQRCRQNDFSLVFGRTTNDELYSTLVSRRSKDLVEAALKESNGHVLHRPIVTCGQNMVERIRSIPEADRNGKRLPEFASIGRVLEEIESLARSVPPKTSGCVLLNSLLSPLLMFGKVW